jgi:hypothetical protein
MCVPAVSCEITFGQFSAMNRVAHKNDFTDTGHCIPVLLFVGNDGLQILPQSNLIVLERYVFELGEERRKHAQ